MVTFKSLGKSLRTGHAIEEAGKIAERRHPAISTYAKAIAAERHWMPKRSDSPCFLNVIVRRDTMPTLLNATEILCALLSNKE